MPRLEIIALPRYSSITTRLRSIVAQSSFDRLSIIARSSFNGFSIIARSSLNRRTIVFRSSFNGSFDRRSIVFLIIVVGSSLHRRFRWSLNRLSIVTRSSLDRPSIVVRSRCVATRYRSLVGRRAFVLSAFQFARLPIGQLRNTRHAWRDWGKRFHLEALPPPLLSFLYHRCLRLPNRKLTIRTCYATP